MVAGNPTVGVEKDGLVELTSTDRQAMLTSIENGAKEDEAYTAERNEAISQDKDKTMFKEKEIEEEGKSAEEIEVEVIEPAISGSFTKLSRSWFSRFIRIIKIFIPPICFSNTSQRFISNVNESQGDMWTKDIAVLNTEGNNCSPVSATMVLRYHGRMKGGTDNKLYQGIDDATRIFPLGNEARERKRDGPSLPLLPRPQEFYENIKYMGDTMPWNIGPGIINVLRQYGGISGQTRWLWYLTTSGLFDRFTDEVASNRPPIVNIIGFGGWATPGKAGHSMPVIGTKKKVYSFFCFKSDERWLYVHSTWRLGDKRWYRFDWYNYPFAYWDRVTINIGL